jgi:hypothetical protein
MASKHSGLRKRKRSSAKDGIIGIVRFISHFANASSSSSSSSSYDLFLDAAAGEGKGKADRVSELNDALQSLSQVYDISRAVVEGQQQEEDSNDSVLSSSKLSSLMPLSSALSLNGCESLSHQSKSLSRLLKDSIILLRPVAFENNSYKYFARLRLRLYKALNLKSVTEYGKGREKVIDTSSFLEDKDEDDENGLSSSFSGIIGSIATTTQSIEALMHLLLPSPRLQAVFASTIITDTASSTTSATVPAPAPSVIADCSTSSGQQQQELNDPFQLDIDEKTCCEEIAFVTVCFFHARLICSPAAAAAATKATSFSFAVQQAAWKKFIKEERKGGGEKVKKRRDQQAAKKS